MWSVEPWLLITGDLSPINIAPLYFLGSNLSLNLFKLFLFNMEEIFPINELSKAVIKGTGKFAESQKEKIVNMKINNEITFKNPNILIESLLTRKEDFNYNGNLLINFLDEYIGFDYSFDKEKIVIKCGGSVLIDPNLFNLFISDITIIKNLD